MPYVVLYRSLVTCAIFQIAVIYICEELSTKCSHYFWVENSAVEYSGRGMSWPFVFSVELLLYKEIFYCWATALLCLLCKGKAPPVAVHLSVSDRRQRKLFKAMRKKSRGKSLDINGPWLSAAACMFAETWSQLLLLPYLNIPRRPHPSLQTTLLSSMTLKTFHPPIPKSEEHFTT